MASTLHQQIVELCRDGNLQELQHIIEQNPNYDISDEDEEAFRCACENGHLDVAKWLLQIKPNIYISINNDEAFRYACEEGHLDLAQWLLQIKIGRAHV